MFDFENRSTPILKWAGGKSGILGQLQPKFPKRFKRFIEPFLGGGAVFFSLKPGVEALLNDCNEELINVYRVVRSRPHKLMARLDKMAKRYSEAYYYSVRKQIPESSTDRAARTIFLNKTGYNGLYRQNLRGIFNVPFGKREKCPALYQRENLLQVSRRLRSAILFNADFEKVVDQAGRGDFVYCDPPYEPLTRTASFNSYFKGGFSLRDQERLHDACLRASKRGATIAISNSTARAIGRIYRDWKKTKVFARRAINSNTKLRGEIPEFLVWQ